MPDQKKDEARFDAPPFDVRPDDFGASLHFKSYGELADWAVEERDFWAELRGKTADAANWGDAIAKDLMQSYSNISNFARRGEAGDQSAKGQVAAILNEFETKKLPFQADQTGKQVQKWRETDPHRALAHIALARDEPINLSQPHFAPIRGLVQAILDGLIDQSGVDAREETLVEMRKRWDGRFRTLHKNMENQLEGEKKAAAKRRKLGFKIARRALGRVHAHDKQMVDIEDSYRVKISVQAAETYWGKRANENAEKAAADVCNRLVCE